MSFAPTTSFNHHGSPLRQWGRLPCQDTEVQCPSDTDCGACAVLSALCDVFFRLHFFSPKPFGVSASWSTMYSRTDWDGAPVRFQFTPKFIQAVPFDNMREGPFSVKSKDLVVKPLRRHLCWLYNLGQAQVNLSAAVSSPVTWHDHRNSSEGWDSAMQSA